MQRVIGWLCIIASVVVFGIAAYMYVPKFLDYKKGRDLYDDMASRYTRDYPDDEETAEKDSGITGETEAETESEGFNIDKNRINNLLIHSKESQKKTELEILRKLFKEAGLKLDARKYLSIEVDSEGLLDENEDYIGWIYIPEAGISYPVVQGKDNNEYLHTNFKKQYNYPGTIFMDYRCKKGIFNHHGILYGHNMRDGSMFAKTKQYTDQKYLDTHPIIWFITPEYKLLYWVFSSYVASPSDNDAFSIEGYDFDDNKEWEKVLKSLVDKSAVKTKQEVNGRDFTLTLSTCTNERTTRVVTSGVLLGAIEAETKQ